MKTFSELVFLSVLLRNIFMHGITDKQQFKFIFRMLLYHFSLPLLKTRITAGTDVKILNRKIPLNNLQNIHVHVL